MDQDVWNREVGHLAQVARMAVAALISAAVTATVVIAVGQSLMDRHSVDRQTSDAVLVRTAG